MSFKFHLDSDISLAIFYGPNSSTLGALEAQPTHGALGVGHVAKDIEKVARILGLKIVRI